jgi:HAD superfamily hydrolase (TIGR01509 family)
MEGAAIFDFDGLLVNTDPEIWVESMHLVAKHNGVDVTTELLKHTKGLRIFEVTEFWNQYFCWQDDAKSRMIAEQIVDKVIELGRLKGKVLPGVIRLLETLKINNVPIGLATSSPQRLVDSLLAHFDLKGYFNVISTADTCGQGKPHPEVYLQCAAQMGVLPWRCVAFEDSINGMVAAKAARMLVVAVPPAIYLNQAQFGLADKVLPSLEPFTYEDFQQLLII